VAAKDAAESKVTSLTQQLEKLKKQANTRLAEQKKQITELTAQVKAKVRGCIPATATPVTAEGSLSCNETAAAS
jgi:ElaB/YqjD/DUF883 family membrane-anchored ribosome-binding protein